MELGQRKQPGPRPAEARIEVLCQVGVSPSRRSPPPLPEVLGRDTPGMSQPCRICKMLAPGCTWEDCNIGSRASFGDRAVDFGGDKCESVMP